MREAPSNNWMEMAKPGGERGLGLPLIHVRAATDVVMQDTPAKFVQTIATQLMNTTRFRGLFVGCFENRLEC